MINYRRVCLHQMNVTTVRENLPKGDFSIMTEMLKKFLNFMNLTVSRSFRNISVPEDE